MSCATGLRGPIVLQSAIQVQSYKTLNGHSCPPVTNAAIAVSNPCYASGTCSTARTGQELTDSPFIWQEDPVLLYIEGQTQIIIANMTFYSTMPPFEPSNLNGTYSTIPNPCYRASIALNLTATPTDSLGCPVPVYLTNTGNTPGAYFATSSISLTRNVVIGRDEFHNCGDKCLILSNATDRVSILKNKFHDSAFGLWIGLPVGQATVTASTAPVMRDTIYENVFVNILRRSPRCASYVHCHSFSNIVGLWGAATGFFGQSADGSAQIYDEANFYAPPLLYAPTNPAIDIENTDINPDGTSRGQGLVQLNSWAVVTSGTVAAPQTGTLYYGPFGLATSVFNPSLDYSYTPLALTQTSYNTVLSGAGVH